MRFLNVGLATLVASTYAAPASVNAPAAVAARQAPQFGGGFQGQGFQGQGQGFQGQAQGRPQGQGQQQGGVQAQRQGGFQPQGAQGQGFPPQGFQGQGFQGQGFQGQGQGGFQGQAQGYVAPQGRRPRQGTFTHAYSVGPNFHNTYNHVLQYTNNINNTCALYYNGQITQDDVVFDIRDDVSDIIVLITQLTANLTAVAAGTLDPTDVNTAEILNLLMDLMTELDGTSVVASECSGVAVYDLFDDLFATLIAALIQLSTSMNNTTTDDLLQQILDQLNALQTSQNGLLATLTDGLAAITTSLGGITTSLGGLTTDLTGLTGTVTGLTNSVTGITNTLGTLGTTVDAIAGILGL